MMTTRAQRNAGLIAVGMGAISFALVTGLRTADGGPDWVSIVTLAAGLVVVVTTGLYDVFHHGSA